MPRVKRGTQHVKRRKKLLSKAKGFMWGRKNLVRLASTAVVKAGAHAYADRRKKKRVNRGLWQIKISALTKANGVSYSKFMGALKANNIEIDRKVLADLAENNAPVFVKILEEIKK
jgi:large subunit ribosomal protein L20